MTSAIEASKTIKTERLSESFLYEYMQKHGRLPPIAIVITPIEKPKEKISLNRFLSYSFNSSIISPIDSFSFTFDAPDDLTSAAAQIRSGDLIRLEANDTTICTGIIDTVDIQVAENGEIVNIQGRDLLGQYEDNAAVSIKDDPIWANSYTLRNVCTMLSHSTRIGKNKIIEQDAPKKAYLFTSQPGENKLSALQRFMEPLNVLAWTDPSGNLVVGRPKMNQNPKGTIQIDKKNRRSNCLSMKATRQTTKIPNIMVPIWQGQEIVQSRTPVQSRLLNSSADSKRLLQFGHQVIKTIVVSLPNGTDAQDLSELNFLKVGGQNLLQAHAKNEMAKAKMDELQVQVQMVGHFNSNGEPFLPDTVYKIFCDRANVDETMYLHSVEFTGGDDGQRTLLQFCRLGSIVSDIKAL